MSLLAPQLNDQFLTRVIKIPQGHDLVSFIDAAAEIIDRIFKLHLTSMSAVPRCSGGSETIISQGKKSTRLFQKASLVDLCLVAELWNTPSKLVSLLVCHGSTLGNSLGRPRHHIGGSQVPVGCISMDEWMLQSSPTELESARFTTAFVAHMCVTCDIEENPS